MKARKQGSDHYSNIRLFSFCRDFRLEVIKSSFEFLVKKLMFSYHALC